MHIKEARKQRCLLPEYGFTSIFRFHDVLPFQISLHGRALMPIYPNVPRRGLIKQKFLHPLRDEGRLRGTTQIVRPDTILSYLFIAITGQPVADYFGSPAKFPSTYLRVTGEFDLLIPFWGIALPKVACVGLPPHSPNSLTG
jgi:hypothetical protein